MAASEYNYEAEIETSVDYNQGQPVSELESVNPAGLHFRRIYPATTSPYGNVSIPEHNVELNQSALPSTTGEPYGNSNILSPALITVIREPGRKVALKNISLECSSPDHFVDELILVIMRGDSSETLVLTKTSPTIWKAIGSIECDHTTGDIVLIVQSKDGGDEAFLTLTPDEIYAMLCTEEGTPVQSMLESVKKESTTESKMAYTIWSNSMLGAREAALLAWLNAGAFLLRFEETRNVNDIDQAILYGERAMSSHPPSLEFIPEMSCLLGNAYLCRFQCNRNLEDIDCAISHQERGIESTPSGHANLPSQLKNLGSSYARRFQLTGVLQDIDLGIFHHQRAVDLTPSDHADLPGQFNNLGSSYLCRFERTGNLQDIDCAISHHQKAVQYFPSGHADHPRYFDNLGSSYTRRFERTGNLHDIDCAISYQQSAINSTSSSDIVLPDMLNNLGNSYFRRFEHTEDLQDINYAISHHQEAVQSISSGHGDSPKLYTNLGNSYLCRFERTMNLQDIDHVILYHQKAVDSTQASGHADLPNWFGNLGSSYSRCFQRTGDLHNIDCAISYQQKAFESTPSGHVVIPSLLNNLGNSYLRRFERNEDLHDIDCAILHHREAVESVSSDHADLPKWFNNLGNSYSRRFNYNHYIPDVLSSIAAYRRGANLNGSPSVRLACAKQAAMKSSVHDRSQCLVNFGLAIGLLSEAAGLEQTIHRCYANLHGHYDFVRYAVVTALNLNRLDLALEWLEQGRCLVWNQLNQLRTPIDDLRGKHPSLANRFITVAGTLESYGSRSILDFSHLRLTETIHLQNDTRNHTLHATQYKEILDEIRTLPDFYNFLRPLNAIDILNSVPTDGPVIVFNIHNTQCDALALIAGIEDPLRIPLTNFTLEQGEQLQKTLRFDLLKQREVENQDRTMPQRVKFNSSSMSFVLKELWAKVVQPILEALGYSPQLNHSDRRRIWWCPTGPLAFLPLHAAGIYGSSYTPGSCISDFAVSSYTPTVQSLKERSPTSSVVPKRTSLVLISPNTPNLPPIPFARAEIHALKALVDRFDINASLLEDVAATTDGVKRELNSHSWVHFACHGMQDVVDPLKSGVHLHDGRLELLEIMRQKLSNPELAFLSACQTSKGDLKLSEEVVHLAAGMLAAGSRGVIGTMWSISDLHGPEFSRWFYKYLLEEKGSEGLDSTRAAYALDYATRKVRETLGESDAAFLTWVTYVHFGY